MPWRGPLGKVGGELALGPLLTLLPDPYAQREAAEAVAELALRTGLIQPALKALHEPGMGAAWRWPARACLGDESWCRALLTAWGSLAPPFRIQALEAALQLPDNLRTLVKLATADAAGKARALWEQL